MDKIYWGASPTAAEYDKKKFLAFCSQSPQKIKEACQAGDGRLKHIISAEHFDISFLETICTTAQAARKIHKTYPGFLKGLLPYKSVVNYFKQQDLSVVFQCRSKTRNAAGRSPGHLHVLGSERRVRKRFPAYHFVIL